MLKVAVVILNYNGVEYLRNFLPSVTAYSKNSEIIVADNSSTDGSADFVRTNYPSIRIIHIAENGGYSKGYNEALKKVNADYYVLLNSDVEVTAGWLDRPVEIMKNDGSIAAVQPKILSYTLKEYFEYAGAAGGYIDRLGYPFCRGRIFLEIEKDQGQYDDEKSIFWATGACFFIKADMFHEVGGLDEDFFAHMEEIDLCWRLNSLGKKIYYTGKSTVYHVGGGTLPKTNPQKTYLNFRNGLTVLVKNLPGKNLFWILPLRFILDWVAALKFLVFDSWRDSLAVLKAHIDFIISLPSNIKKRRQTLRKNKRLPVYRGSIVFDHFLFGKKRFDELGFDKKQPD